MLCAATLGCVGTTGSGLVTFQAYVSGPSDAIEGKPLEFDTGRGFHVSLSRAVLHVGALYLNRSVPISGAQETGCILPGLYVAQVIPPQGAPGLDVDLLSPKPQLFPGDGNGTADAAFAAEVWLTGGDVDAQDDPTVILDVEGNATKGAKTLHFTGAITIGKNWQPPPLDSSQPGSNPVCKQRIASPIKLDAAVTPRQGGALFLAIDPRPWFANVEFSELTPADADPRNVVFANGPDDAPSRNLFLGLHASRGVYSFSWH